MPNSFEQRAIQRLIDQAAALGVEVPKVITDLVAGHGQGVGGAILWARANPGADGAGCCWGDALGGAESCTCWVPVFDVDQADPILPTAPEDVEVQRRMCGDCAFRRGSPERAEAFMEETLFDLAATGTPFYCHDGMRRPVRWEHPDGRTVAGSTDDWQPPMVAGLPYRTDGRPGLLCAGWAARASRADAQRGTR